MDLISTIAGLADSVIKRLFPDKSQDERDRFSAALQQAMVAAEIEKKYIDLDIAQNQANVESAKSSNLFIAGARPFIMWGLGIILVLYFFLSTIANFSIALGYHVVPMPPLDSTIRDIVLGLLGLGWVARSWEKGKGVK